MKNDIPQNGRTFGGIGDEAVYLRINQLQKGLLRYGTGANGKSAFLNVIQNILGDYALSTWAETFMKRNNDTAINDIAQLRGARFVTTSETEQGSFPIAA